MSETESEQPTDDEANETVAPPGVEQAPVDVGNEEASNAVPPPDEDVAPASE